jgi:DNA mismatch repair protein MutL
MAEVADRGAATLPAPAPPKPAVPAFDLWRGEHPGPDRSARAPRVPLGPVPSSESLGARRDSLGEYRYLGQIAASYLLIETTEGLRIVDPHALHERILFDDLEARRGDRFGDAQRLLVPETIEMAPAEALALEGVRDELAAIGYEIEAFGPRSAAVRAVPAALARAKVADVIRDLADVAGRGDRAPAARLRESAWATIACRAAVKFGDRMSDAQAESLLARWRDGLGLDACPHGRPTSVVITLGELERLFGRRR